MRREVRRSEVMAVDIIIASTRAVKFGCTSTFMGRLANVSGQPQMSGPDNSRNYNDFVSKCGTSMREILLQRSLDQNFDVAGEISRRLADNQTVLDQVGATHVPPSGRPKKGKAGKKAPKKLEVKDADERPQKAKKTAQGQTAPEAANGAANGTAANSGEASNADAEVSMNKRKQPAAKKSTGADDKPPESYYSVQGPGFLESYSFTRVIFDEFSFEDHEVTTFVERAVASSKWLLSGTPTLTHLSWVCCMASMLNVHVARIEPALPTHLHEITQGPSAADMSASEAYRALRHLKTTTFAHERHLQGQKFVEHFMRRNRTVFEDKFNVVKKVVFVSRDTPAIAHYLRLQQCMFSARWDGQDLSLDGNDLVKPILDMGSPKIRFTDDSRDGRLDKAIQVLLLHTMLPSQGFHDPTAVNTAGMTILDSLERLAEDAKLSYLRLCSTLKSQFDRLMFGAHQFSSMAVHTTPTGEAESNDQAEGDDGGDEGDEDAQSAEEEEAATIAPTRGRPDNQTRDRKFRLAKQYLDALVDDILNEKEESIGGLEILNLLRTTLLADRTDDPAMRDPENWAPARWQRVAGGPGTSRLIDWYPDLSARLSKMSLEELIHVCRDCACLLDRPLPDNLDSITPAALRRVTEAIIRDARARRREQFEADDVEKRSGLADGSEVLQMLRMRARRIGLKCLPSKTVAELTTLHNKHKGGSCPLKFWEFGLRLPFRYPVIGMVRRLRGTNVEEGLEDLTWTSQSVTEGAYERIPEAFHRFRFLRTVICLAKDVLDGRVCDGCGETGVPSDAIRSSVGCDHAFCEDCTSQNTATAENELFWCRPCRGNGETRTMLDVHPRPGLFCHGCRKTRFEQPSDAHVLPTCGHLLCPKCIGHLYANPPTKIDGSPALPRCDVHGCGYPILENDIRGDKLVTKAGGVTLESLGPGGKLQKMVEIVTAAKDKGEKVLVFVPYEQQFCVVAKCLKDAGITVARTDETESDPNRALAEFQDGTVGDVLLQRLSSSASAGSNLTNANHIIFVGPYFNLDQREWQMVIDQAGGRCVRPGQKKDVFIYLLAAENSLDVDVLEHHLKRRLEPDENGEVDLSVPVLENEGGGASEQRPSERGSLLQSAELDMLFRKKVDYNDTENLF